MNKIIKKLEDGVLLLEVNKKIYNKEAITRTAYKFTDMCYMHITNISEDIIGICIKHKAESKICLDDVIDKFCNELIDQQIRIDTEQKYGSIRDAIVKQAFSPINVSNKQKQD